jgi:hypothetical protein
MLPNIQTYIIAALLCKWAYDYHIFLQLTSNNTQNKNEFLQKVMFFMQKSNIHWTNQLTMEAIVYPIYSWKGKWSQKYLACHPIYLLKFNSALKYTSYRN